MDTTDTTDKTTPRDPAPSNDDSSLKSVFGGYLAAHMDESTLHPALVADPDERPY